MKSDFTIIDKTKEAENKYGYNYGSETMYISREDIISLLTREKQLAVDINGGEYTLFIQMAPEEQDCTPKEWETCNVEKMGCAGCHYDNGIHLNNDIFNNITKFKKATDGVPVIPTVQLKDQYGTVLTIPPATSEMIDDVCTDDEKDINNICLHCGENIPAYCNKCYELLICKNSSLQMQLNSSFPKNTVLEFMDGLRNILISGERDELKNKNIMSLYIQYIKELSNG